MSETVTQALRELVEAAEYDAVAGACLSGCKHPSCERRRNESKRMAELGKVVADALAAVEHERDSLRAQLDTAQEELAAVRRVDLSGGTIYRDEHGEWTYTPGACDECDPGPLTDADIAGGYSSPECPDEDAHREAKADSLAALGRLLTEGDDATT